MPTGVDFKDIGTVLGTLAGAMVVAGMLVYKAWSRFKLDQQVGSTETQTLQMLDAAVAHWKELHDTAWSQVVKERELREAAEQRGRETAADVDKLRSRVATLERKIDQLQALVDKHQQIGG